MKLPHEVPISVAREYIDLGPDLAAAILLTLHAGWERAARSVDIHLRSGEVVITEHLRDNMRAVLKTNQLPWAKTFIVAPGTESRSVPDQLVPDGRTDIPIYLIKIFLAYGEHDPHAIVECKRISGTDANLCREYVLEGIDRFRTGKYAENHAIGFMAGYLVSGDDAGAVDGVNAFLGRQGRTPEFLVSSDLADGSGFWRSRHPRNDRRPAIDLHHAFFGLAGGND